MMTSRDRVIRTLNHQPVDRAPRELWAAPSLQRRRGDELAEMRFRFPDDLVAADFEYPRGPRSRGSPAGTGPYTDAWGSTWHGDGRAASGGLVHAPLIEPAAVDAYQPPWELLDAVRAGRARVDRSCGATSRFILARTETRPFERLQALRGPERVFLDLADGAGPIRDLLAKLHDFSCREMELWAETDVDGVAFGDDWGSQAALLVSPDVWRDLFAPLYRQYCDILRGRDKFAFFRSGGYIAEVFHDLVTLGIDAIHTQLFTMDVEALARHFRGRITFWGEIDRQRTLPLGTPQEVREAVLRVRKALDFGRGGLIAQCQWDADTPFENVAAVFKAWIEPVLAHA